MKKILISLFLFIFSNSFGQYISIWQKFSEKEVFKKNKIKTVTLYSYHTDKGDSSKIESAEYDLKGNIITDQVYFNEKNKPSDIVTTKYKYDEKNNLVSYTVSSINDTSKSTTIRKNSYNEKKLLIGYKEYSKYSSLFFCNYTYDKDGNIISMENNHRTIVYEWKDKRLIKEIWGGGLFGLTDSITYNYNSGFSEMKKKEYDKTGKIRFTTTVKYNSAEQKIYESRDNDPMDYETYFYKDNILVHIKRYYSNKLNERLTYIYTYY